MGFVILGGYFTFSISLAASRGDVDRAVKPGRFDAVLWFVINLGVIVLMSEVFSFLTSHK